MHELSITEALIEQINRRTPAGMHVLRARVEIGPRQSIDEDSLRFAWEALVPGTALNNAALDLDFLPWSVTCLKCHHKWNAIDPLQPCRTCGSDATQAGGSNDLRLLSLEVSPEPQQLAVGNTAE
jgi:hydrogenase nickel incorporation protein HypA/HybF